MDLVIGLLGIEGILFGIFMINIVILLIGHTINSDDIIQFGDILIQIILYIAIGLGILIVIILLIYQLKNSMLKHHQ